MNQCDGCQAGFPLKNGTHINPKGKGVFGQLHMGCTASRYVVHQRFDRDVAVCGARHEKPHPLQFNPDPHDFAAVTCPDCARPLPVFKLYGMTGHFDTDEPQY